MAWVAADGGEPPAPGGKSVPPIREWTLILPSNPAVVKQALSLTRFLYLVRGNSRKDRIRTLFDLGLFTFPTSSRKTTPSVEKF